MRTPFLYRIRPAGKAVVAGLLLVVLAGSHNAVQVPAAQGARDDSVLENPRVRALAAEGLDQLYNMQFDAAAETFTQIEALHPRHPIGPFLQALNTWWQILLDLSDTSHDKAFFQAMDEVIGLCDRMLRRDRRSFDAMFFKGAALGFRGRLLSNRGDWVKAAMDGKRAMDYVLYVAEQDPNNPDFIFGKGLYDYYADVIPKRYAFAKPVMVFFPDGDRERGLRELEYTAQHGYFIQTEAAYFLLQIYYLFEQDFDKSVAYATWLRESYPDNSFFHTLEGRIYARWGRWEEVDAIFQEVLARYDAGQTGYNDAVAEQSLYYLARGAMAYGDYEAALGHLQRLDAVAARTDRDTYFEVMGQLRQGMAQDALGRRELAVARYRQVLAMRDVGRAHERAEQYLKDPYR